ncbi:MAG: AEC family transporter [Clostridia bacterium]|nr:AEC family transporter [Clostridia bacterium]
MNISLVLNQMIILVALMIVGFIAHKIGILNPTSNKSLSKLIINITCPALIFHSIFTGGRIGNKSILVTVFIAAFAFYIFMFAFSKAVVNVLRVKKHLKRSYECMMAFGNISFMGIPVLRAVFPDHQSVAILFQAIFVIFYHLFIFTYGIWLLGKDSGKRVKFSAKSFLNAGTLSAIAAVILYFFDFTPPAIVTNALDMLGSVTTPLSMILIGSSLASYSALKILKTPSLYLFSFIKLLVIPMIVWGVTRFFIDDALLHGVITIMASVPVGSMTIMLSTEYGGNNEYISQGLFMTTVLSVFTIPLISYVIFNF